MVSWCSPGSAPPDGKAGDSPVGEAAPFSVLGVHLESEGYPNVRYRLAALRAAAGVPIPVINHPFRAPLGRSGGGKIMALWRLLYAHAAVLGRYLVRGERGVVYLPYPAVFVLFAFSFLPRSLRPRATVADVFISLYDTVVNDRRLLSAKSLAARLLWWMESRAYSAAEMIVVDTELNAADLRGLFPGAKRVVALPLSIDEAYFQAVPPRPAQAACHVVFIGTFVPLQGVETIAAAALRLRERADIRFTLVGDGQTASAVEAILGGADKDANVHWIRQWQNAEEIRAHISSADLCLGIFGEGDKAQRVWPFKNYHYMAAGRALLTGDTACARDLVEAAGAAPFATTPCSDAEALADAIAALAGDPARREQLARDSAHFFETRLSSRQSIPRLCALMAELAS